VETEEIEIVHSKWSMVSWDFGKFINEFFKMAFGMYVFYFYEMEIKLNIVWVMAAQQYGFGNFTRLRQIRLKKMLKR